MSAGSPARTIRSAATYRTASPSGQGRTRPATAARAAAAGTAGRAIAGVAAPPPGRRRTPPAHARVTRRGRSRTHSQQFGGIGIEAGGGRLARVQPERVLRVPVDDDLGARLEAVVSTDVLHEDGDGVPAHGAHDVLGRYPDEPGPGDHPGQLVGVQGDRRRVVAMTDGDLFRTYAHVDVRTVGVHPFGCHGQPAAGHGDDVVTAVAVINRARDEV